MSGVMVSRKFPGVVCCRETGHAVGLVEKHLARAPVANPRVWRSRSIDLRWLGLWATRADAVAAVEEYHAHVGVMSLWGAPETSDQWGLMTATA